MKAGLFLFSALFLFSVVFVPSIRAEEVRISAAASLTDACKEIIPAFNAGHPNVKILANYSASGSLAKQIVQGAPADIFISASPEWMTYLADQHRIVQETVSDLAYNTLVFIGREPISVASLAELRGLSRIAIGSPRSVPAGQYAQQAMVGAGIYEDLLAGNKLVMAQDVRQALLYADRAEVDGAFVYKTDALLAQKATILFSVPENLYDRIAYPMALTVEGAEKSAAREFETFLKGLEAKAILKKFGFGVEE